MNVCVWLSVQAAIGIANLLVMAMLEEGKSVEEAVSCIWMVDTKGLIVKVRVQTLWHIYPLYILQFLQKTQSIIKYGNLYIFCFLSSKLITRAPDTEE